MTLEEAIKHAEEKAEELREEAELLRDMGERIANPRQLYNEPVKACRDCAEEHRQLAEWLKELKRLREQTRWIPVSERLPEDFGTYLTTLEYGDIFQCDFNPDFIDEEHANGAFTFFHQYSDCAIEEVVYAIAWMPFEPYKAESEE